MEYKLFINNLPKKAIDIRFRVFTIEQGFAKKDDLDEFDSKSIHIIVYQNSKAIATARMFKENDKTYHIGRIAVLKKYRNNGVGSFILSIFESKSKELGANKINIGSQIDKTGFYEKCGYEKHGDIFDDAGYPHIMMQKQIK